MQAQAPGSPRSGTAAAGTDGPWARSQGASQGVASRGVLSQGVSSQGVSSQGVSSRTGLLVGTIIGGGFTALLAVTVAMASTGTFSSPGANARTVSGSADLSPADRLSAAADRLERTRAIRLDGWVSTASDQMYGGLKVTKTGQITGDVAWNGKPAKVLLIDDKVFVQAGPAFWTGSGRAPAPATAGADLTGWGRAPSYSFTPSLREGLTPRALAERLRQGRAYGPRSATRTTVRGRPAMKIRTYGGTFYVSYGDKRTTRLLRAELPAPGMAADITELSGRLARNVTAELRTRVGRLRDSFDTSRPTRTQKVEFGACDAAGCTVKSRVWSAPGLSGSVRLSVRMWLTAGTKTGRDLGSCTTKVTIVSSTPVWATCRITDDKWRAYRAARTSVEWWGHADATVAGVSEAEIHAMLAKIGTP